MAKAGLPKSRLGFSLGVTTIVALISSAIAMSQANSPFVGQWKANLSKSRLHPNHLFKSASLRFELSDDVVLLTFSGVNMAGNEESGTRRLRPDGKEYPIAEAPGIVEVVKWIGSNTLQTVATKEGKVMGQGTYEVSSDGKTLTATIKGIDGSGRDFDQVIVFERE